MTGNKDYYETLGVEKDASPDELRKQYRKLSMQFHPDRQVGKTDGEKKNAEDRFKEVNEAYSVLSDPEKRRNYDMYGNAGGRNGEGGFSGFSGFNPMDFFRKMSGFGFDDGPDSRERPRPGGPEDGTDIQTEIGLTFKESVFGCNKEFDLPLDEECGHCHGTGMKPGTSSDTCAKCGGNGYVTKVVHNGFFISQTTMPCPECHGMGWSITKCPECGGKKRKAKKRHIRMTVPAGAETGSRFRLAGMGHCGVAGGADGDLYVITFPEKSNIFERNGDDLFVTVPISPVVASVGGAVKVPTLKGWKELTVKAGTKNGEKTVVPSEGVKTKYRTGNLIVTFEIEPITSLTSEQKSLLEKLHKTETDRNFSGRTRLNAEFRRYMSND